LDDSSPPLISVIIPTLGSSALAECLASAEKALAGIAYEILVSKDCGLGVSEARNRGLLKAKGQYFLILDDDCLLESSELTQKIISRATEENHLHGGVYSLKPAASYWAQVYSLVNNLWLDRGQTDKGFHQHLLGGFLFGSKLIKNQIRFSTELKWGGEEKELLQRLESQDIYGKLHKDLVILHSDNSGFSKFIKRAFFHGWAAGEFDLQSPSPRQSSVSFPWILLPGLALFYVFSRSGLFLGKLKSIFGIREKAATSSPTP
jgi:glycosyltransferase involved in cell wall biosynthesis